MKYSRFRDVTSHGFIRVAVVIPRVYLSQVKRNLAVTIDCLKNLDSSGVQYAIFPELNLTGYSNQDLFHSNALLQAALKALESLVTKSSDISTVFTVGLPIESNGAIYNCAVTIFRGKILGITPKTYLPEYREFYEQRHFASATDLQDEDWFLCGQSVPVGNDLIIRSSVNPLFRLHTEICEDGWVPISPGTKAALAGALICANLSASNITIGKADYRRDLVTSISGRNLSVQLYAAAGFGESSTDLAWDGDGYIAERGALLAASSRFNTKNYPMIVIQDVDVESLVADRMRQGSFRQNATEELSFYGRVVVFEDRLSDHSVEHKEALQHFDRFVDPHPFVPSDRAKRDERCNETFMIQSTALARRLLQLPEHMRKVVIGLSGGQDSTHALNVAVYAMNLLELPLTNIIAVTMPGFGTTGRTYQNACALAKALGVTFKEIEITETVRSFWNKINHNESDTDLVFENSQAWTRKVILLLVACKEQGIDLGTGDLSELLIGWCTYGGDHLSHYGINAGVPKTLITYLIHWTADVIYQDEPEVQAILRDIVDTPVSPELLPADDNGDIAQKTEEINGPYEVIDFFGYYFVRFGFTPSKIVRLALEAFQDKYTLGQLKGWLENFIRRFFINQFKRSMLPDGPKVGLVSVSPRGDWRMPSDVTPDVWLDDLATVPDIEEL